MRACKKSNQRPIADITGLFLLDVGSMVRIRLLILLGERESSALVSLPPRGGQRVI